MWNIRYSAEDQRGRDGKLNGKKSERETDHERLWTPENKQGYRREGVGGWGNRVMGIKEGTCCDEHWVLYATNELLNTTTKTYDVLYVG